MSQISVTFSTDNAAFEENPDELATVFSALAQKASDGDLYDGMPIRDTNGNTVGTVSITD